MMAMIRGLLCAKYRLYHEDIATAQLQITFQSSHPYFSGLQIRGGGGVGEKTGAFMPWYEPWVF